MRTLVTLACTDCKRRNYTTTKNKQTQKAKASAARAARKEARVASEVEAESNQIEATEVDAAEREKKRIGSFKHLYGTGF